MNLMTIFSVTMLIVVILTGVNLVAQDLDTTNMDGKSVEIISALNDDLTTNYNSSDFEVTENELTVNSSFVDVDPFARQYLEDKSETEQKKGVLNKITGMPDLLLYSIGIENNDLINAIKAFIVVTLGFIIGLAIYIAIRTGEVKG